MSHPNPVKDLAINKRIVAIEQLTFEAQYILSYKKEIIF